ncbi:hypothetical protein [Holdemania massiliensis]|uniref:hypothetical protein n=1 Tax=Holdemania massiliensis TaxID=1468449 RepID=UPI00242EBF0E|nr:hypothetical protein [Holdemania massiliensis]
MDGSTTIAISLIVSLAGCFVGLAGWLSGRDKKISGDAEWRGAINAKLDIITGVKTDVSDLQDEVNDLGKKVVIIEQSAKSAHHRLDEHLQQK